MEDQVYSIENLNLAWERIQTGLNYQYKKHFRSSYGAYSLGLSANLSDLSARLNGGSYRPKDPHRIYLPKPSGLHRPITVLRIEDQIVLQAFANLFANKLETRRSKLQQGSVFSNVVENTSGKFFFRPWKRSYHLFNKRIRNLWEKDFKWLVTFDLAAFYDTISHKVLIKQLFPRDGSPALRRDMESYLEKWSTNLSGSKMSHSIPQGPISSDYLAECFLMQVDERMSKSYKYVRYVDDIRILAKSEMEVRQALLRLEELVRERGLIPQSSKTSVRYVRTQDGLYDLAPSWTDQESRRLAMSFTARKSVRLFKATLSGSPQSVNDRRAAKFALNRATPSYELTRTILKLAPSHPELAETFGVYFDRCLKRRYSEILVRRIRKLSFSTPYGSVRFELMKLLSWHDRSKPTRAIRSKVIEIVKRGDTLSKLGATYILLSWEMSGYGNFANFLKTLESWIVASALGDKLQDIRPRKEVVESLLIRRNCEASVVAAQWIAFNGLNHGHFGIKLETICRQTRNVMRSLGLVRGALANIDPVQEILSHRFGQTGWDGWKLLLGKDYAQCNSLVASSEKSYYTDYSKWLSLLDSFNDILVRKIIDQLRSNSLTGGMSSAGSYGTLLDKKKPFSRTFPRLVHPLYSANKRRNGLPHSHPVDKQTGGYTRELSKIERGTYLKKLSRAYEEIPRILSFLSN